MSAPEHTFIVDKGATFRRTLVWRDAPDSPIDLTDYSANFLVEAARNGKWSEALSVSSPSGITITEVEGRLEVMLTDEQTGSLDEGHKYRHSLFVTAPNEDVTRLIRGSFVVIG